MAEGALEPVLLTLRDPNGYEWLVTGYLFPYAARSGAISDKRPFRDLQPLEVVSVKIVDDAPTD